MKMKTILLRMVVLIATMMCALGVNAAEAYACYTSDNTTLTFYYDNNRSSQSGTTYDLNIGTNDPGWYTDGTYASVTKVVFDPLFAGARPKSTSSWFSSMQNLLSIEGMRYLNTSEVTNMDWMFLCCSKLTSLDLSSFNTSKVNGMVAMFKECSNLKTIYVGRGWNTANVIVSTIMFSECTSLVGGQGTTWKSSNPTDQTYARIDGGPSNPGYFTVPQEAYACYTSDNTTLTFYYDNQRSSREGTTYDLNTNENDPGWYNITYSNVTKVVFDPSFAGARPTTTYSWFSYMRNLESIEGMSYLNTSEVTNMVCMFDYCPKLTDIDLSHFNTAKVTDMAGMFRYCEKLTSLDLSSFNTSKVTLMNYMFYNCSKLRTIYVGDGWSTVAVKYGTSMFYNCTKLVGGKGTTYDADYVDIEYARIDGAPSDLGYFTKGSEAYTCYTSANKTLTFYFDRLRSTRSGTTYALNTDSSNPAWYDNGTNASVTKVVFDSSFANAQPTNTYGWFSGMRQLQTITDINYLNTCNVTNMIAMFRECGSLTTLDLSNFNTSKVTNMNAMFYNCSNLLTIYVGNGWSTAAVTSSAMMFTNCTSLVGGKNTTWKSANPTDKTYARIDGGTSNPGYFTEKPKEAYACYTSENTTLTFYYDNQRVSRSNTYNLNAGGTSPVWMTNGTYDNVTKVVFDPSFADARPTTTFSWLYGMTKLQSIEGISHLSTSDVTNMSYMFFYCSNLTSLDLSSFNTSKVTKMDYMFGECSNLRTIYVGDGWNTEAVTSSSNMFYNCTSLVGGKGTTWKSSNPKDKTYAHIDGGSSNPGYFTIITAGITTGLENAQRDAVNNGQRDAVKGQRDEWFTIDGQKLSGKPDKKGVYIVNGQKVVIK